MRWTFERTARVKRQYASWQVPRAISKQLGLENGDECAIAIKIGRKTLQRVFRLTSGCEFRLSKADQELVKAAAADNRTIAFELDACPRVGDSPSRDAPIYDQVNSILSDESLTRTQKEQQILARVGQGVFRSKLIKRWAGCAVTGCSDLRVLVASHIKPWSKSTNAQRLDPNNGLLLTPNIDRLFDQGLISFSDRGRIMLSGLLSPKVMAQLGIEVGMSFRIAAAHKPFMAFHRDHVFTKVK